MTTPSSLVYVIRGTMLKNAGESFPLGETALKTFKAACAAGWSDKDDCVVLEIARGKTGDAPLAGSS